MTRGTIVQICLTIISWLALIVIVTAAPTNELSSRSRSRARNTLGRTDDDKAPVNQPRKRYVQDDDQSHAETAHHHPHPHHGGGSGGGGGGQDHSRGAKNFMYAHQPSPKTYEFGYKRGNDHHTIERYEKAGPKHNFNTKVRWTDAKGGHGEMYWDYNHVPHSHGKSHGHGDHHDGHHSEPVPSYVGSESKTSFHTPQEDNIFASDSSTSTQLLKRTGLEKKYRKAPKKYSRKRGSKNRSRATRQKYDVTRSDDSSHADDVIRSDDSSHVDGAIRSGDSSYADDAISSKGRSQGVEQPSVFPEILGFDPYAPPPYAKSRDNGSKKESKINDSYSKKSYGKNYGRRRKNKKFKSVPKDTSVIPKLAYDLETGRVYDENTETWFKLVKV